MGVWFHPSEREEILGPVFSFLPIRLLCCPAELLAFGLYTQLSGPMAETVSADKDNKEMYIKSRC